MRSETQNPKPAGYSAHSTRDLVTVRREILSAFTLLMVLRLFGDIKLKLKGASPRLFDPISRISNISKTVVQI